MLHNCLICLALIVYILWLSNNFQIKILFLLLLVIYHNFIFMFTALNSFIFSIKIETWLHQTIFFNILSFSLDINYNFLVMFTALNSFIFSNKIDTWLNQTIFFNKLSFSLDIDHTLLFMFTELNYFIFRIKIETWKL